MLVIDFKDEFKAFWLFIIINNDRQQYTPQPYIYVLN